MSVLIKEGSLYYVYNYTHTQWFQQSHTDAGVNITSSLSHVLPAMTSRARAVSERLKDVDREINEKAASGTPPHELQQ